MFYNIENATISKSSLLQNQTYQEMTHSCLVLFYLFLRKYDFWHTLVVFEVGEDFDTLFQIVSSKKSTLLSVINLIFINLRSMVYQNYTGLSKENLDYRNTS